MGTYACAGPVVRIVVGAPTSEREDSKEGVTTTRGGGALTADAMARVGELVMKLARAGAAQS